MPGLQDSDLDDFIQNRRLFKKFVRAAIDNKYNPDDNLSDKQKRVYGMVLSDLDSISNMLAQESHDLVLENEHQNKNYSIEWDEHDYANIASVRKKSNDFFWTVSVVTKDDNKVEFMHITTNGSLNDVQNAFNETSYLLKHGPIFNVRRNRLFCRMC